MKENPIRLMDGHRSIDMMLIMGRTRFVHLIYLHIVLGYPSAITIMLVLGVVIMMGHPVDR